MSTTILQITDELLEKYIGYEVSAVTNGGYYLIGTLNYNTSPVYDEYKFSITDSSDSKVSYYINAEDLKTVAIKLKGD